MYTSYFANLKRVRTPVSISRYSPKWYDGPEYKLLAPSRELLRAYKDGDIDMNEYVRWYRQETLSPLDAGMVYEELCLGFDNDVTLLCYERPDEFCHRRIVAAWFQMELNIEVKELPTKPLDRMLSFI